MKESNENQLNNIHDFNLPVSLINTEDDLFPLLLAEIQGSIAKPSFDSWFYKLSLVNINIENRIIVFGTDTQFKREWLETRYLKLIEISLKNITDLDFKVSFIVSEIGTVVNNTPFETKSRAFDFLSNELSEQGKEQYREILEDLKKYKIKQDELTVLSARLEAKIISLEKHFTSATTI